MYKLDNDKSEPIKSEDYKKSSFFLCKNCNERIG